MSREDGGEVPGQQLLKLVDRMVGDAFATSFPVGLLHSLLHAGCSENIIRLKEHLPKNHTLAPLRQAVSDIAGDDVHGVNADAFAAPCQSHGTGCCSLA